MHQSHSAYILCAVSCFVTFAHGDTKTVVRYQNQWIYLVLPVPTVQQKMYCLHFHYNHIYVCVFICVYIYVCVHLSECAFMSMCVCACLCVHVCIYVCAFMCVYFWACVYVSMCVCACVYVHACVCK